MAKSCTIEDCTGGGPFIRGWCTRHYQSWKKHGDPLSTSRKLSPAQRFWSKVNKAGPIPDYRPDLGPCWIWTAGTFADGYGQFSLNGRGQRAHRVSYRWVKGEIPEGLDLDHLCRVIKCVNPDHLEAVPPRINNLRGMSPWAQHARKTHCPQNHPYDEENTRLYRGSRQCRACQAERNRARGEARSRARLGVAS